MSDNTPELPEIQQLTEDQINRLLAADWLESLAILIRRGQVEGFNLSWDDRISKPQGPVTVTTNLLKSPLELKVLSSLAVIQEAKREKEIIYQDLTEDLKEHKCNDPRCIVCKPPHEA